MNLSLYRDVDQSFNYATFGEMEVLGHTFQTVELPWVDANSDGFSDKNVSCVPKGEYALELHSSAKHRRAFALVNHALGVYHHDPGLPNTRCEVLLHSANTSDELLACIALGFGRGTFDRPEGKREGVTSSRAALSYFNTLVPWVTGHLLVIK